MVRTFFANRNFSFDLKSRLEAGRRLRFSPNGQKFIGFGGFYKKAGIELGFKLPVGENRVENRGTTKSYDFQLNFYGTFVGADLTFQKYRGFYVRNPQGAYPGWSPGSVFPQFPTLQSLHFGANTYLVFNRKRFSYRAAFAQTERQMKSAGSFIAMTSAFYLKINTHANSLVPAQNQNFFGDNVAYQGGHYYIVSLLPGYAYTFVIKKFYISTTFCTGLGLQRHRYVLSNEEFKQIRLGGKSNLRIAGGYYGNTLFTGGSFVLDNTRLKTEKINLLANTSNIKVFVGCRF